MLSGILRGLGDSVSALGFLLLAAALNVILDIWFVAGFNMGVAGVSLATVISQAISAVFCFLKLMRMKEHFDLNRSSLKLDKHVAMRILTIGVPSGITQAIMSMSMMIVQSLTNSMGEMVIAANVIIMRVDGFAMMPNFTFGQAMSVYTGQNVGAGKWDRVQKGVRQGSILAQSVSIVLVIAILIFGKYLFAIFTSTTALIELAGQMMRIMAVGYIAVSVTQVLGGVMRGCGDTVTPMWISILTTVALRMPLAYILAHFTQSAEFPNGHPFALSISLLITWVMGMVFSAAAFRWGKTRKMIRGEMEKQAQLEA